MAQQQVGRPLHALVLLLVVSLLALPLAPQPTWAQQRGAGGGGATKISELSTTQREKLGALLNRAKSAYETGEFDKAARSLEEAYTIFAAPNILYRLAEAYAQNGETRKAIDAFERYLVAKPDASDRAEVDKRLTELRASQLGRVRLETNPQGATVYLNTRGGKPKGVTPLELKLEPGTYTVYFYKAGFEEARQTVEVVPQERARISQGLTVEGEGLSPTTWFYISGGTAVVAGLTALAFFVSASSLDGDLDAIEATRPDEPRPADYNDRVSTYNTYQLVGLISTGVTLAALGASAALYFMADARPFFVQQPGPPQGLRVSASAEGWQLGWSLRF